MIQMSILEDENLQNILKNILSGMLNTKDLQEDSPTLTRLLNMTFSYIHLDEMEMEYYVLFSYLNEINKLFVSNLNIRPELSRDTLERILLNDLESLIRKPQVRIKNYLRSQGMQFNLDIMTNAEDAMSKLYQRTMELYDICKEKDISPEQVIAEQLALARAYINNVSAVVVNSQVTILNGEFKMGRKRYAGPEGWLAFCRESSLEIESRIAAAEADSTFVDSIDVVKNIFKGSSSTLNRVGVLGIPPLDDMMLLNRHRFSVICALENVGKTKFMTFAAVKALLAGNKVRIMYGESQKSDILANIMVAYIYFKEGIYVTTEHIINLNDSEYSCNAAHGSDDDDDDFIPPEVARIINKCVVEVIEHKQLALVPAYEYEGLYDTLKKDYETRAFDFLGIDHSCTLTGEGKLIENIDKLASALRDFKRDYPVCVMVLSQLSTAAKDDLSSKGIVVNSPTKGSATLSQEADAIIVMNDKGALVAKKMLSVQVYKARGVEKPDRLIMLKKEFPVSNFIYDIKLQLIDENEVEMQNALDKINTLYNDEGEQSDVFDSGQSIFFDDEDDNDEVDDDQLPIID